MVYINKNEMVQKILVECDDACGIIDITQFVDDNSVWIGYYEDGHYFSQGKFRSYFKRLWNALLGREYLLFDIMIQPKTVIELKDAVSKLKA